MITIELKDTKEVAYVIMALEYTLSILKDGSTNISATEDALERFQALNDSVGDQMVCAEGIDEVVLVEMITEMLFGQTLV